MDAFPGYAPNESMQLIETGLRKAAENIITYLNKLEDLLWILHCFYM